MSYETFAERRTDRRDASRELRELARDRRKLVRKQVYYVRGGWPSLARAEQQTIEALDVRFNSVLNGYVR